MRARHLIFGASVAWVTVLGVSIYFAWVSDHDGRPGVHQGRVEGGKVPAILGAQDAPPAPEQGKPTPGERQPQRFASPGFASESPRPDAVQDIGVARSQGVRLVPESASTKLESDKSRPAPGSFRRMATDAASLCGVPVALFHALIERESSWRPHVVSSAGAVGLAQVKPSTGRGVSPTLDVRDPWQNLVAGACYLRQQFDRFGTWRAALHAYRVGPNAKPSRVAREYAADIISGSSQ